MGADFSVDYSAEVVLMLVLILVLMLVLILLLMLVLKAGKISVWSVIVDSNLKIWAIG